MRENRQSGSEGGETLIRLPYPYREGRPPCRPHAEFREHYPRSVCQT